MHHPDESAEIGKKANLLATNFPMVGLISENLAILSYGGAERMKSNKKFNFGVKGYYIALILCAVAIGICGYLYYRNATEEDPQLQDPTIDAGVVDPGIQGDLPVVGTQPGQNDNPIHAVDPSEPAVDLPMQVCHPLTGQTITDYAMDCLAYNETTRDWRVHDGIDIAAEAGSVVCAAADGTVYTTYKDDTMGMTVVIRHDDGYVTVYSSLAAEVLVSPGDIVTMGQTIGAVGNTALVESAIGDHLHFAVMCDDESVDPMEFLSMND